MIIIFFVLNTMIFLCTSLAISMFDNNLKKVSKSIDIYLDPKAYKPESEVKLISLLLDKYKAYESELTIDLDSLIKDCFYNHKIGRFRTLGVETIANRGKGLLWVSIIMMVLFEAITIGLGKSMIHSIWIIMSAGLGIMLVVFQIYTDIEMGKEQLFIKIKNHLHNEYPQFKINQKTKEEVSLLLTKINELEAQIKSLEKMEQQEVKEDGLEEEDIAQILRYFVLPES